MIFKLAPNGSESVLYGFGGTGDVRFPYGSLVRDAAGNLYGVTMQGGAFEVGTVFKLDANNNETIVHSDDRLVDDSALVGSGKASTGESP